MAELGAGLLGAGPHPAERPPREGPVWTSGQWTGDLELPRSVRPFPTSGVGVRGVCV